jgi:cystathionine beta-lyase
MSVGNPFTELTLDQLRTRTSAKWRRYDADVLPLWVAEMDVPLAPPIREALERVVRDGDTGYPGSTPYVESFVDFAQARWPWPDLAVDAVAPVSSVIQGYTDALLLATGGKGTVVVTSPVYPPFFSYLRGAGLEVTEAPLTADLRLDFDAIEQAFAAATGSVALLLCNPHNPGGTLHTRQELETLAALAERFSATVVSDEIHAPLTYPGEEFVPYLAVEGGSRGIALHAASKAWNLAAMPAALLVAGPDAADLLKDYRAGAHHWPTHFGAIAQTAAYREGGPWLQAALAGLDANRHLLGSLLAEHVPGAKYHTPASTYLTWVDCRALGLGDDPADVFLKQGRVAFNSGPTFGTGGEGHVRINIATHPDILEEAVRRMASVLP